MGVVLFSYELGAGFGHLAPLVAVAEQLSTEHRLVFALPDVGFGTEIIQRAVPRAEIVQGLSWKVVRANPNSRKTSSHSFADALIWYGFGDRRVLSERVESGSDILTGVKPDLVVSNLAPALRLAAAAICPVVVVADGYCAPPRDRLLPPLRPWRNRLPALSRAREFRILETVNRLRDQNNKPPVNFLSYLFRGDATFVCTLPTFDPYAPSRREPTVSPITIPQVGPGPLASARVGPDVFVYLQGYDKRVPDVLRTLQTLGIAAEAYIAGRNATELTKNFGGNIVFYDKPASFEAVLPKVKLIVHHGGIGTCVAGLAAGTPQLNLPLHMEHGLNSRAVESLGAGRSLRPKAPIDPERFGGMITDLLTDEAVQRSALAAAPAIERARREPSLAPIAAKCESYLNAAR